MSVGYGHVVAVTYEHTVFSWGEGGRGQLGHGDTLSRSTPQLVEALKSRPVVRYVHTYIIMLVDFAVVLSHSRGTFFTLPPPWGNSIDSVLFIFGGAVSQVLQGTREV